MCSSDLFFPVLVIVLLAAAGFFGLWTAGKKEADADTEPEKTVIYFFHNNPCESCHEGEKFRELVRDTLVRSCVFFSQDFAVQDAA